MDIGQLLELQGALQGDRVVEAASQVEEVRVADQFRGELADRPVEGKRALHDGRHLQQPVDQLPPVDAREVLPEAPEGERDHVARRHRRREGLRGCHADLGSGVDVERPRRLARQRRSDPVGDPQHRRPAGARRLDGAQRVIRLSRLGDGDDQRVRSEDEVAVAELGGDVHFRGKSCEPLDHEPSDERGVVRRAAGDEDRPPEPPDAPRIQMRVRQRDAALLLIDPALERVGHRAWLLVDLLEHEVRVAALLGHGGVPGHPRGCPFDRSPVESGERAPPRVRTATSSSSSTITSRV